MPESRPSVLTELAQYVKIYEQLLSYRFRTDVPTTTLIDSPAPVSGIAIYSDGSTAWVITRGDYALGQIRVYLQDPARTYFSIASLKNVWLHEFLHHVDHTFGIPCPVDHNDLFRDRLIRAGLWEPDGEL